MSRAVRSATRVDAVLLLSCVVLALLMTVLPLTLRDAIAGGLRRTVVAPLVTLQQQAERGRSAFLSREATTSKLDSLSLRTMELQQLEQENDQLRKLLGLGKQLGWGFVSADALQGRGLGEDHTITLTAGRNAGVQPQSPVVAPDGLVGSVLTVDPESALAILYTHPDFRVSAMSTDGSAFGIVQAHLGTGPERYLLEMRGVRFRSALKPGTLIVSSGLGGVYPRGIPVGMILGELETSEGWARTYLVRPAVKPHDVTTVMVLRPQRASNVEGVWGSVVSADSAARRVAAAGDSIARAAAAAAARRQAADSAPRPETRSDTVARPTPRPGAAATAPAGDTVRSVAPPSRSPAARTPTPAAKTPTPAARAPATRAPTPPTRTPAPVTRTPTATPRRDTARPRP